MKKRTVTVAYLDDNEVVYEQIDDCYVCPYDTGDKFATHTCRLTGEFLYHSGRVDIDVPETCPFPAIASGGDSISDGIIDRYPGINQDNVDKITKFIDSN